MVEPFHSSRQHLYAALARLDLLIQREVWRWRNLTSPAVQGAEEFRGLYISDAEVDAILSGVYPGSDLIASEVTAHDVERAFGQAIADAERQIAARVQAARREGISLCLERLRTDLDLSALDVDALLVALAPEVDLRYERLYAYLQDDVTRKRPSVALLLNLLCADEAQQIQARRRFEADAPLRQHHLLDLVEDPAIPQPPLLARYAVLDPRIAALLLAEEGAPSASLDLDERLRDFCQWRGDGATLSTLVVPDEARAQLVLLAERGAGVGASAAPDQRAARVIALQGERGTGKRAAAEAICAAWERPLLEVNLAQLLAANGQSALLMRLAAREAVLCGAALYWRGYDEIALPRADESPRRALHLDALHAALRAYPVVSLVPLEDADREVDSALLDAPELVRVQFDRPSYALRRAQWEDTLAGCELAPETDVTAVAGRFRLTQGQIQEAGRDAHHRAAQRPPGARAITTDDLFAAARARTSDQLRDHATKIEPRHDWGDLVLPLDQVAQLHEMCDQMKFRHIVLGEWGFDRKLSMGKGLNALFAGPSGTGKTMGAEVVARDLGLDLYKIDLSTVMSKYVGETEKNLERIFRAARNSNAILFFDEADALFGKRSEVRDAHDRYANVEISYLLQRMEEYDGLVILTSNLSQNMDEAFVRRMHFTVEFPYPEAEDRQRIWEIVFPQQAPLSDAVDFGALAERYRLTGGNIRNIALTAAFLAARDGGVIDMQHLLWATRREFQKMGRLADEREFAME
ncbi:MAG: ATP-binding protein [Anaerolineae bacterium]|nr:ATP-binding protein [Anaerolineae bacterium]